MTREEFLKQEATSRDTIDVKKIYIDIAEDIIAGIFLSQLMYWHLPTKDKKQDTKLEIIDKDGNKWLAKKRYEWWNECRLTKKQVDRAIKILKEKKIIETKIKKFKGDPQLHIRINFNEFLELWNKQLQLSYENIESDDYKSYKPVFPQRGKTTFPKGERRPSPKGKDDLPQRGKTLYTKTTTENTTKTTPEILYPQAGEDAKNSIPLEISSKEDLLKYPKNFDNDFISVLKSDFVQDWDNYSNFLRKMVRKELDTGEFVYYNTKLISKIYIDLRSEYGEINLIKGLTELKKQYDNGIFPYYTKRLLLQFIVKDLPPKAEIIDNHIKYTCSCNYPVDLDHESSCPKCHMIVDDEIINQIINSRIAV